MQPIRLKNEKTFRRLFLLSYRWFLASLLYGQVGGNIIQTKEAQRMTVTALCETRAVGNMALGNPTGEDLQKQLDQMAEEAVRKSEAA